MSKPRVGTRRRPCEHESHTPRPHARQWCTLPSAYSTGAGAGATATEANASSPAPGGAPTAGDVERLGPGDGRADDRLNGSRHTAHCVHSSSGIQYCGRTESFSAAKLKMKRTLQVSYQVNATSCLPSLESVKENDNHLIECTRVLNSTVVAIEEQSAI